MGKRCACDHLIETMRNDPRMRIVPAAARYLWMALADAWSRLPEPGVFRMGMRVGSIQDISWQVSMPIPEVETCLENLKETQMITQDENGVWVIPALQAMTPRGSVSAQNGRKSLGRPRKGETPNQYKLRLLAVCEGGLEVEPETQDKPSDENPALARVAAKLSFKEVKQEAKQAAAAPDITQLGNQLVEIAGMDVVRGMFSYQPIEGWVAEGATEDLLVEVFTTIAGRRSYTPPKSLVYFNQPVREAIAQCGKAFSTPKVESSPEEKKYWESLQRWKDQGCYFSPPEKPLSLQRAV